MKQFLIALTAALTILSTTPARSDQSSTAFLVPDGGHIEQRQNETIIYDRNWQRLYYIQQRPGGRRVILDKNLNQIGELQDRLEKTPQ